MRTAYKYILLLVAISALAYLPLILRISYSFDDWYLMYSAKAYGPQAFHAIYSVDRPLRAYVLISEYFFFGGNPILYNLSAWLFRLLSAIGFWWILQQLWPVRRTEIFAMAALFVVYPGFLSQFNGIDYQSQMISLAAAMFSIALTLKSLLELNWLKKWGQFSISVLLGWLYLGLVEYEIGFEFLRVAVIAIYLYQANTEFLSHIKKTALAWLPVAIIPGAFIFWRIFLFHAERKATDVNTQLGSVLITPGATLTQWLWQTLQSTWTIFVSAWWVPLFQLRSNIQAWGVGIAFITSIAVIIYLYRVSANLEMPNDIAWPVQAIILGFVSAVIGLIPIILVNREVYFPYFSRYSLVSSTGVVIFFVGLFSLVRKTWILNSGFALLIFLAMLTQHANAQEYVAETNAMNQFWWQVAWRIPMLEKNTTLIASYPRISILEDYFVWGPANMIYYPNKVAATGIQPGVYAALSGTDTVQKVLAKERQVYDNRRNIITYANYRNILILSQPTPTSCVQVIDGSQPVISSSENANFIQMAPFSDAGRIITNEKFHIPPRAVFGSEPVKSWCYFFEKADLARQVGEWQTVVNLAEEAQSLGLAPSDQVEWMPFLQGYLSGNDVSNLQKIASQITDEKVRQQACMILVNTSTASQPALDQANALFCAAKK